MGARDVFSSISRLFDRYCDHHYALYLPGFAIIDGYGQKRGQIERICYGRNSLRVEGWCKSGKVALGPAGRVNWQVPDILRADVNAALSLPARHKCGFNLARYGETQGVFLSLKSGRTTLQIMCPQPGRLTRLKAQAHIRLSFLRDVFRASLQLARALISPTAENRQAAKRALRMGHYSQVSQLLEAEVFERSKPMKRCKKLTLVMPVFNAAEVLQLALARIVKNTDLPWRLILVEDCSTDPNVRPMLRRWRDVQCANGQEIVLIENDTNLGFIRSVNRAFEVALEHRDHVVLINSDALVPVGWAQRLLQPMLHNARVASVTPLSNDAEIFSAPVMCQTSDLAEGVGDRIDDALGGGVSVSVPKAAPTGVGFCMAMKHEYLRQIPKFDTVFGRGYGEEVDWCQKVSALGGLHMCQPALFVEHRGGASFGSVEKQAAIARNNQLVSKRYPGFDQSVQHFIATDPLRTARLLAGIAHLDASQDTVPIYIAHSLGGGAELYLQERIAQAHSQGLGVVVLRLGGAMRWRVELHTQQGKIVGDTNETQILRRVLSPISSGDIIYSCAVGDRDPMGLIDDILRLKQMTKSGLTVLVHDYFPISPSYCMLDAKGIYHGVPDPEASGTDHAFIASNGAKVSNKVWRQTWGRLLQQAQAVVCFSQSSKNIMSSAFPDVSMEIEVRPHDVSPLRKVCHDMPSQQRSIGVLGDIGQQKGARVLSDLSTILPVGDLRKITIVGRVDPRFALTESCVETGAYQRSDIPGQAEKHGVAAWLIPSIWPETFSYTTHEALATGLPVFCFDIGAQGEAVTRAENGHPMPLEWANEPHKILTFIQEVLADGSVNRRIDSRPEDGGRRGVAA